MLTDQALLTDILIAWREFQAVPSYVETQARRFAREIDITPDDLQAHLDDELVTLIRNGEWETIPRSFMTEDERREAFHNAFNPCGIY